MVCTDIEGSYENQFHPRLPVLAPKPVTGLGEVPTTAPSHLPERGASTGTVDDVDEPEDERDGENEESTGEIRDDSDAL
jgi:hypothetical protein